MTKLTQQQQHHHHHRQHQSQQHCNCVTPQHERSDPSCCRKFSVVHRDTLSPRQELARIQKGHASAATAARDHSEPKSKPEPQPRHSLGNQDKAETAHITYATLHSDYSVLAFDLDRMSEHDPSSGDGEDDQPSPDPASYPPNPPVQWKPSPSAIRPPQQPDPKSTNYMTGKGVPTKSTPSQSGDRRQIVGQATTSLPTEKVFPIQVGTEVFRLSGASISSDGPSYFTQYFEDQVRQSEETVGVRTLYIDRDSETFRDIARHLQGYYVKPRDGPHFVRLFADAQFYSLPRLISQLFESEIFIQIGEQHFQIPKDIFSDPGNSPNFFSLGFAVFFSTPSEVFPGLDRRGLLRPPPINPPYVPGRSAEIFSQLLHLLRGYPLEIRDEAHRTELLRDCRYFHLRGLEQRIVAHEISYNLERRKSEICLRIDDLRPSGISYRPDNTETPSSGLGDSGWVYYARPFVDEQSYELIVEIGGESTCLNIDEMRVDFHGRTKARVASLFQVIANKMGLPSNQPLGLIMLSGASLKRSPSPGHSPLSEDKVRIRFEAASDIQLDNKPLNLDWESEKGRHMRTGPITTMIIDDDKDADAEDSDSQSQSQTQAQKQRHPSSTHHISQKNPSTSSSSSTSSSTNPNPPPKSSHPSTALNPVTSAAPPAKKRKIEPSPSAPGRFGRWIIRNAQWRVRVEQSSNPKRGKYEIVFVGVKVDAFTDERARNVRRGFLG